MKRVLTFISFSVIASFTTAAVEAAPLTQDKVHNDSNEFSSVSSSDLAGFNARIRFDTQGAGTPNKAGLGVFIPLHIGTDKIFFVDGIVNYNFDDLNNFSSLTKLVGKGNNMSTSTRFGYRWLSSDKAWMYGFNAGFDTRTVEPGANTFEGFSLNSIRTASKNQIAVNAEIVGNKWSFNAYGHIPSGDYSQQVAYYYEISDVTKRYYLKADNIKTFGLDIGRKITDELGLFGGYYYQESIPSNASNSGVLGRISYALTDNAKLGLNYSYDNIFNSRVSANLTLSFGPKISKRYNQLSTSPAVQAISTSPGYRDLRAKVSKEYGFTLIKGIRQN